MKKDKYRQLAARLLDKQPWEITQEERKHFKAIAYAYLYGENLNAYTPFKTLKKRGLDNGQRL